MARTIRQNIFARSSIARGPYVAAPHRRLPNWGRRAILGALALLLLLIAVVACQEDRKADSLAMSTLDGPRLVTGPVCIEEAVDLSGSMTRYTAEREQAERALFTFAVRELQEQDLLSEAFFAATAVAPLPPTRMTSLTAPPPAPGDLGGGTLLAPAIDALVAARPADLPPCAARALVVITDAIINDDPGVLSDALGRAAYTRMYAVVPSGVTGGSRGTLQGGHLDAVVVMPFREGGVAGRAASILGDANPLDVVFGVILSDLTGQELRRSDRTQGTGAADARQRDHDSRTTTEVTT